MHDPVGSTSVDLPLVFQGRLNEADVIHIRHYHGLLLFRRPLRWAAGAALTLLVAACIWWALWWSLGWGSLVAVAWFVIVWVYLLFLLPWDLRRAARRHYRKHEAQYLETRVSLVQDRITIENEASQSCFQWQVVGLVAVTPEGLLFCNQVRQVLFWLPRRLFEGNRLREQVLRLAAGNGVSVRRLS